MRADEKHKEISHRLELFLMTPSEIKELKGFRDYSLLTGVLPEPIIACAIEANEILHTCTIDECLECTRAMQTLLKEELEKHSRIDAIFPPDIYLLRFVFMRQKTSQEIELLKIREHIIFSILTLCYIQLYAGMLLAERAPNRLNEFKSIAKIASIAKELGQHLAPNTSNSSYVKDAISFQIITSHAHALACLYRTAEQLKLANKLEKIFIEREKSRRLVASETGRNAVLEGKWNLRGQHFETLKPLIDKYGNSGLRHHKIAEKLSSEKRPNGIPITQYLTSGGLPQNMTAKELKGLIKSYFKDTDRAHLIHGMK